MWFSDIGVLGFWIGMERDKSMENRKRDIQIVFRVTAEEKAFIQQKMSLIGMTNFRACHKCTLVYFEMWKYNIIE